MIFDTPQVEAEFEAWYSQEEAAGRYPPQGQLPTKGPRRLDKIKETFVLTNYDKDEFWKDYGFYKECKELCSVFMKLKLSLEFRDCIERFIDVLAPCDWASCVKNLNVLRQNIFHKKFRVTGWQSQRSCF